MSASLTVNKNVSGLVSVAEATTVTGDLGVLANPSVPKAQPGTLTTRTNNVVGTLTMTNSNHGITTGSRIDLYWASGSAYHVTVGTVSTTSVPITVVGSGSDVLPSTSTAIQAGIATLVSYGVTGDNLTGLVLSTPQNGYFTFVDGSGDVYAAYVQAGKAFTWLNTDVDANPLAGDVPTGVYMSHSYTTSAVTLMKAAATSN